MWSFTHYLTKFVTYLHTLKLGRGTSPVSGCPLSIGVFLRLPTDLDQRPPGSTSSPNRIPPDSLLLLHLSPHSCLVSCLLSPPTVCKTKSFLIDRSCSRKGGQRGRLLLLTPISSGEFINQNQKRFETKMSYFSLLPLPAAPGLVEKVTHHAYFQSTTL